MTEEPLYHRHRRAGQLAEAPKIMQVTPDSITVTVTGGMASTAVVIHATDLRQETSGFLLGTENAGCLHALRQLIMSMGGTLLPATTPTAFVRESVAVLLEVGPGAPPVRTLTHTSLLMTAMPLPLAGRIDVAGMIGMTEDRTGDAALNLTNGREIVGQGAEVAHPYGIVIGNAIATSIADRGLTSPNKVWPPLGRKNTASRGEAFPAKWRNHHG